MLNDIPLTHLLILSTLMFFIGIYGFITRKNLFTVLMSVELVLNAAAINFVAFNAYLYPGKLQGQFFALFIIGVAAAEAALAIAIIIIVYKNFSTVDVEKVDEMKY